MSPLKSNRPNTSSFASIEFRQPYWWSFLLRAVLVGWVFRVEGLVALLMDARSDEYLGGLVARDWLAGRQSVWLDAALNSQSLAGRQTIREHYSAGVWVPKLRRVLEGAVAQAV